VARNEWFVYQNGTPPTGPLSSEQVLRQHSEGALHPKTLVCPAEGGEWQAVAEALPALQARPEPGPAPWFIFREGRPPLGPLTEELVQRGISASKIPSDALMSRANGLAWYSQARALAEPVVVQAQVEPALGDEARHEKTAVRAAVVAPPAPPPADAQLARERMILAGFCAVPVLLGLLIALAVR